MTVPADPAPPAFFLLPDGRRMAYRHRHGAGPTIVFLPGYRSDMAGSKAQAVWQWARTHERACLLFDYAGCGQSDGDFAQGTLSRWRDEALRLIDHCAPGPLVLVGSSMGGWLMLVLAQVLGPRAAALVGIAAAPDFTDWGYDDTAKTLLAAGRVVLEANPYGPDPTPTHPAFWADGQALLCLTGPIEFAGPVRLMHGQADADVPWPIALRLGDALCSGDVQIHLIKDGDHRLSRDADIALLLAIVARIVEGTA